MLTRLYQTNINLMSQCSACCAARKRIMNNDKPLDHAIDQACELARRQVQGLFPVQDICMNTCPNKFRPQYLKRKQRRHFEK